MDLARFARVRAGRSGAASDREPRSRGLPAGGGVPARAARVGCRLLDQPVYGWVRFEKNTGPLQRASPWLKPIRKQAEARYLIMHAHPALKALGW